MEVGVEIISPIREISRKIKTDYLHRCISEGTDRCFGVLDFWSQKSIVSGMANKGPGK